MHRGDEKRLLQWRLKTAAERYKKKLEAIDADLARQRSECSQEYQQVRDRLDAAVTKEQHAVAQAKADRAAATEQIKAAQERRAVAQEERKAKSTQKKVSCKVEADAIRGRKKAEREHQKEVVAIERSTLKRRPEPRWRSGLHASEKREQVEDDVPEQYKPLWKKVGRTFRVPKEKEGRASLLEAFLEFAAEDPEAVAEAQEGELQAEMRRLQREENKAIKGGRGKRSRLVSPEREREIARMIGADEVPF